MDGHEARRTLDEADAVQLRHDRAATRTAGGLLFVLLSGQLVAAWMPVTWIANHITFDDTYLLLRVAEGWAETGRPTFDGIHPTNGFQAAWGVLVWLIAEVTPDHGLLLHVTLSVVAGLNTLTGWLLWRFARRLAPGAAAGLWTLAFWTAFALTPRPSQCGLENAVLETVIAGGLCVWQRLRAVERAKVQGVRAARIRFLVHVFALALLSGLAVWTRLDMAVVVAVIWAALSVGWLQQRRFAPIAIGVVTGGVLAGGLAAFYLWAGGTPTPVSGLVKRVLAARLEPGGVLAQMPTALVDTLSVQLKYAAAGVGAIWPPALSAVARVGIVVLVAAAFASGLARLRGWLVVWGLALLAHGLALRLTLGAYHLDTMWYFMPEQLSAAVLVGVIVARAQQRGSRRQPRIVWPLIVGLAKAPLLVALLFAAPPKDSLASTRLAMAAWLQENVPPAARLAAWNAGELAYFSRRTVINLDGLVNSREYFEAIVRDQGDLNAYLAERDVDWVVDYARTARLDEDAFWGVLPRARWEVVTVIGEADAYRQLVVRRQGGR